MDGLVQVQDCSNSIANALELLQSCSKPSIWYSPVLFGVDTVALGQLYNYYINSPGGHPLKDVGKIYICQTTTKHKQTKQHVHYFGDTV